MLLTLFLSENTPIALTGFFLLVPLIMILFLPVIWLSRPKSSSKAKIAAFTIALLPMWLGSKLSDELGGWVNLLFYLPFIILIVNVMRSESKS